MALLTREDILDGLSDLIAEIHEAGATATLRIVGGGAMALKHGGRRTLTQDVDALRLLTGSEDAVIVAVERIGLRRGWPSDWLNFEVANADAEPLLGSRTIEWDTVYDRDGVIVQLADKHSMLAMKLRAARPGRDTEDIRQLLALCEITSVDEADELYDAFYPGDSLSDRAWRMVTSILSEAPLIPADAPGDIDLTR